MPGGVMLQIGIHYTDVLEYLIGPVKAVSGRFAQLVLPGDNPDVASVVLEHENGALSTLNASYASASEYYMMNIYGKEASAYYDMHRGLRVLKRGGNGASSVQCAKNDTFVEELEEFAKAVRGEGRPEMGGEGAIASLAVIRAGIVSAREGRRVEVAEILSKDWDQETVRESRFGASRCGPGGDGPRAGSAISAQGRHRDHRALSRRLLGGRHGAGARRRDVETARRQGARGQPPGSRWRDRLQIRRIAETGRLFGRLEFQFGLHDLSLRDDAVRLQCLRRGGARAGRVACDSGARRLEVEGAPRARFRCEIAPQGHHGRKLRRWQPHPYLLGCPLQSRGRRGGGRAFRCGAGGAEPARWTSGRGAAASRGAVGPREIGASAPARLPHFDP